VYLRLASLDLGDRVSRDRSKLVGFGTYGIVSEGTLNPEQTKVAVKAIRYYGDKSALPVLEVGSLYALSSAMSHKMYQKLLQEVHVWSKLDHENVIKLLGVTTAFDRTISIVSPLMSRGDAYDYVQDPNVDPRPLVFKACVVALVTLLTVLFRSWESQMDCITSTRIKKALLFTETSKAWVSLFSSQTFVSTNPHNSATFWSLMKDMRSLATLVSPISLQRHLI